MNKHDSVRKYIQFLVNRNDELEKDNVENLKHKIKAEDLGVETQILKNKEKVWKRVVVDLIKHIKSEVFVMLNGDLEEEFKMKLVDYLEVIQFVGHDLEENKKDIVMMLKKFLHNHNKGQGRWEFKVFTHAEFISSNEEFFIRNRCLLANDIYVVYIWKDLHLLP